MNKDEMGNRFPVWLFFLTVCVFCLPTGKAAAGQQVTYRLKWLINASTAGDVFALHHGYFSKEGLVVTVKAGGPERDAIRELEIGYADFGVASADQVIRAAAKGARVVVLAQLFQRNPLQWIYRGNAFSLSSIKDLAGKTIGITYGGNDETIMRALLASAGMDETQVVLASVRYDYTPFFQEKVPIWPVYRNTQGIFLSDQLKSNGERAAFFDPSRHGISFVANSVVTSQKMMHRQPETVARFTRALLAGWTAAMRQDKEPDVLEVLTRYDRDTSKPVLTRQLAATRQLVHPDPRRPLGRIDKAAWRQTEQIMVRQKLVPAAVGILDYLKPQE